MVVVAMVEVELEQQVVVVVEVVVVEEEVVVVVAGNKTNPKDCVVGVCVCAGA